MQEELKTKNAEEIIELKKETYPLIFEKDHLFDSEIQLEEAFANAYKYIYENTVELDVVTKARRLGEIIIQL